MTPDSIIFKKKLSQSLKNDIRKPTLIEPWWNHLLKKRPMVTQFII